MQTVDVRSEETIRKTLPLGVYLLAFSLFAMGSTEFLVAGVLPAVAADLGITLSSAGAMISTFAVGVVIGGPPLAVATLRWPRRTTLVATQIVFAASVVTGLLADNYAILLITRFVSGLAYAGFFAVAAVTAIKLVTPDLTARASGVVVSGISLAMIAGGPASATLSYFVGWQGGFWAVAGVTVLGAVLTLVAVPATSADANVGVRRELRAMRQPRLWIVFAATLLATAAYMISYNYLAAFLVDVTGISAGWVPAVLTLFGVGAFAGVSIGGRIADGRPFFALMVGGLGIMVFSALLAMFGGVVWVVLPVVILLGIAGFVLNPAIYGRVFTLAADAPTLAGATTVSAFQLGISLVPVLAAPALNSSAGIGVIPWIGVGLGLAAVLAVAIDRKWRARPDDGARISSPVS